MAEVEVTAGMIKQLRERTGVGMGKCKEALVEARGDMELAIANLRKAGIASAVKKEGREAKEGMIAMGENDSTVALVEVNVETDFVVKNDKFQIFTKALVEEICHTSPANLNDFLQQKCSQDPKLSIDEFLGKRMGKKKEKATKRFGKLDKDGNKSLSFEEFKAGIKKKK